MHRLLPDADRQETLPRRLLPAGETTVVRPAALRAALLAGSATCVALALLWGDPAAVLARDPDLGLLLRGMAAIKFTLVAGGLAALLWRFGRPIGTPMALGYLAAAFAWSGAATLIWQLSALAAASLVFHVGTLSLLLLAWRDGGREGGGLLRRAAHRRREG